MEDFINRVLEGKDISKNEAKLREYLLPLIEEKDKIISTEKCVQVIKFLAGFTGSGKTEWVLLALVLKSLEKSGFTVQDPDMIPILNTVLKKIRQTEITRLAVNSGYVKLFQQTTKAFLVRYEENKEKNLTIKQRIFEDANNIFKYLDAVLTAKKDEPCLSIQEERLITSILRSILELHKQDEQFFKNIAKLVVKSLTKFIARSSLQKETTEVSMAIISGVSNTAQAAFRPTIVNTKLKHYLSNYLYYLMYINPLIPQEEILAKFRFDNGFLTSPKEEGADKEATKGPHLNLIFPLEEDPSTVKESQALNKLQKLANLIETSLDHLEDQKPYQYEFVYYLEVLRAAVHIDLNVYNPNLKPVSNVLRYGMDIQVYRSVSKQSKLQVLAIWEKLQYRFGDYLSRHLSLFVDSINVSYENLKDLSQITVLNKHFIGLMKKYGTKVYEFASFMIFRKLGLLKKLDNLFHGLIYIDRLEFNRKEDATIVPKTKGKGKQLEKELRLNISKETKQDREFDLDLVKNPHFNMYVESSLAAFLADCGKLESDTNRITEVDKFVEFFLVLQPRKFLSLKAAFRKEILEIIRHTIQMNQIKINEYPLANSAQIFLQNVQKGEEVPQIQILCKEISDILAALCSRGRTIIEDDSTIAIHNYFDTKFKRINDEIMDIENAKTLSITEPSLVIEKPTEESTISQKDPTLTTPQTKMAIETETAFPLKETTQKESNIEGSETKIQPAPMNLNLTLSVPKEDTPSSTTQNPVQSTPVGGLINLNLTKETEIQATKIVSELPLETNNDNKSEAEDDEDTSNLPKLNILD